MKKYFISSIHLPDPILEPALWFIFENDRVLLQKKSGMMTIPHLLNINHLNVVVEQQHYLGLYETIPCFAAAVHQTSETTLFPEMRFEDIRRSHTTLDDEDLFCLLTKAKEILHWDKSTQFCGHCGQKTEHSKIERAKICPICKTLLFPPISPVMLALIWREDEILLARSSYFAPEVYSILAGFVEPGETLEQTVSREVQEEVGITIKNCHYFSSQSWPFPSNLMLGFIAEYDSGDIKVDTRELEDAQWFSIHKLPTLPRPISLSRRMIDRHIERRLMD